MSHQHQCAGCETLIEFCVREDPMRTWVNVAGELDLSTTDAFDRCVWETQTHSRRVVLDLRALVFIDSAGLRSLLAARLRAIKWHQRLDVVCGTGQVRRMLSISGFDQLIQIIETRAPAQVRDPEKAAA